MTQLAMSNSFAAAISGIGTSNKSDLANLLERLLLGESEADIATPLITDERGCSVDQIRVNNEICAIARRDGDDVLLLHTGTYDDSYNWVHTNCVGCDKPYKGQWIPINEIPGEAVIGLVPTGPAGAWYCTIANSWQLGCALDAAGLYRSSTAF
jgi:hypothetical protein